MIKIRGKFIKDKDMRFIGHLDLMRVFQRAFRRADVPVKYTEGFNPQPKLALATALPLGVTSQGEYLDVELEKKIDLDEFIRSMNEILPNSIKILKVKYTNDNKSTMSLIRWSSYIVGIGFLEELTKEEFEKYLEDFFSNKEILITKTSKKRGKTKEREVNIRDLIKDISILDFNNNGVILKMMLKTGSSGNLKPIDVIGALINYTELKIIEDETKIQRLELFIEEDGEIVTPI